MNDFTMFNEMYEDTLSRLEHIPCENSLYQEEVFVIAAQKTPGRAYRQILLRLKDRLRALKHVEMNKRKLELDIRRVEAKLSSSHVEFEKEMLKFDLEDLHFRMHDNDHLIRDAIITVQFLYRWLQKFPRYTRTDFEKEEPVHFHIRLSEGTNEKMLMEQGVNRLEGLIDEYKVMGNKFKLGESVIETLAENE